MMNFDDLSFNAYSDDYLDDLRITFGYDLSTYNYEDGYGIYGGVVIERKPMKKK